MPTVSTITAVSAAAGIAASIYGGIESSSDQKKLTQLTQQQEAIRKQQMELENERRQRQIIRQAQAQQASAIATAANTGTLQSSVLPGALGQIDAQAGSAIQATAENTALSRQMFDLNSQVAGVKGDLATDSAIQDFGKTLFSNSERIGKLGNTLFDGNGG